MGLLDGKVAVVTGAGRGIGRSHSLELAAAGAKVVVNDLGGSRDGTGGGGSPADDVVEEIKKAGGEAVADYSDISTMAGGESVVKAAVDAFGRLDVMVANAGILRDKTLLKMEEAQWDAVIKVHLKGSFACLQAAGRQMVAQKEGDGPAGGRIILTSSYSGLIGNFGQGNYGAAKGGIYSLTRVASMEFRKHGITVNALAPVALTRMTEDLGPMFTENPEMDPRHNTPIVLWLASDGSSDVTGEIFGVRGNQIFRYRMIMTEPVHAAGDFWTPEEVGDRIAEILEAGEAKAKPQDM